MVETYSPETLDELLDIRLRQEALLFAGGTDLMVRYRRGTGAVPELTGPVAFLHRCDELKRTAFDENDVVIGAAVTFSELLEMNIHPALKSICEQIGAPGLRNIATIGGNICNASPAADTLPFLYAHDAAVELESASGIRTLSIEEYITGPGKTVLRPDEVLSRIRIPVWKPTVWHYRKVGTRKANALTKVSFAGFVDVWDGIVAKAAFAFGAIGPTVIRARELERAVISRKVEEFETDIPRLLSICEKSINPIDDQRSTAVYRTMVAKNLLRSFLTQMLCGET